MRTKRSIKDSLKEYLNWCVGRLLLGGSRDDTVRDMVDAISDEIASGGGGVSQDQLDQTVKDITKSYGIADQTILTSAEQYTDQKIADVVDGSPEALDTLYELAKALGDDPNFATTVMDQIGQKLPTTTFENFIDNKAWTKDNLTKLSQLINNINSIKAGTRVESMDVNLASISSYLEYDLFDNNTTGTKPPGLTTGFLLTFSWDNGGWGAQIATSDGNVDGAIFLRTIKASESDKIWGPWVSLYNTANFNPDNYLPLSGNKMITGDFQFKDGVAVRDDDSKNIIGLLNIAGDDVCVAVGNGIRKTRIVTPDDTPVYRNDSKGAYRIYDSGNFNPDDKFGFSAAQLSDLNNAPNNAFFVGAYNAANAPVADSWSNGFTIAYGNNPNFRKQFCYAGEKWWTRAIDGVNWGTWRQIWDSGNFNPDDYLPKTTPNVNGGIIINGETTVGYRPYLKFHIPGVNYSQFVMDENGTVHLLNGSAQTPGTYKPLKAGPIFSNGNRVWDSGNFNPDSKFPYLGMGGVNDNSNEIGAGYSGSSAGGNFNGPFIKFGQTSNYMTELYNRHDQDVFQIRRMVNGEWQPFVSLWHSGNLGNATTSKAGLMSAADKTKLDGLSGGRLRGESPTYIFPGDPSKLSKVDSLTTITSILGTASDFLDAFNNGRVFISKTVTFSGVQVPSDIIYSLLKSEDPDTPTVFHIIMSIVIWGHYIEITVDFENNEYQAISNTINGIIGVNTTGTTN